METVYIRADMNPVIATGHIMRCLSVADAIRDAGGRAVFITADEYPLETLKKRGYEALVLHSDWRDMEGELPGLFKRIEENKIKRLLVDSYQVTEKYLSALEERTRVIYLDDLDRFVYPVSAIICYANYWRRFSYASERDMPKESGLGKEAACEGERPALYLGTDYVPLRKAFRHCGKKEIRERIKNVLALSGGTDPCHVLEKVAELFWDRTEIRVDIVCGAYDRNYKALCEKYQSCPQIFFHQNVSCLEELMKKADLAVSAGGTALYELCAVGVPAISYSFADNQLFNVEQFAEEGIIDYAGDARREDIAAAMEKLIEKYDPDRGLRKERSLKMQKQVDGKGAGRIARILLEPEA